MTVIDRAVDNAPRLRGTQQLECDTVRAVAAGVNGQTAANATVVLLSAPTRLRLAPSPRAHSRARGMTPRARETRQ